MATNMATKNSVIGELVNSARSENLLSSCIYPRGKWLEMDE